MLGLAQAPALGYHASAVGAVGPSVAMITELQGRGFEANITYVSSRLAEPTKTPMNTELYTKAGYTCVAVEKSAGDEWCATVCEGVNQPVNKDMVKLWMRGLHGWKYQATECSPQYCTCYPSDLSHEDMVKVVNMIHKVKQKVKEQARTNR